MDGNERPTLPDTTQDRGPCRIVTFERWKHRKRRVSTTYYSSTIATENKKNEIYDNASTEWSTNTIIAHLEKGRTAWIRCF